MLFSLVVGSFFVKIVWLVKNQIRISLSHLVYWITYFSTEDFVEPRSQYRFDNIEVKEVEIDNASDNDEKSDSVAPLPCRDISVITFHLPSQYIC